MTHPRSLKNLDLGGNDAGPDGALALAEALAMHPSLTLLELGYNPLGPHGAATIAGGVRDFWECKLRVGIL
jgi:hypothetical protein